MKKIIVCFLMVLNIIPVFADYTNYTGTGPKYQGFQSKLKMNQPKTIITGYNGSRRQNLYHPHHCPRCHERNPHLSRNDLYALEKYALNKTYRRESDLKRLERLENLAFGATQTGDVYSRYRNVEDAILSRPQYGTKQSVWSNIANYFAGQATGFTPNMNTYNNLGGFSSNPYAFVPAPNYNNNSFEQYSNGIFGGGWGMSGSNFGTGSSVKILD